jgi:hypothetical protein
MFFPLLRDDLLDDGEPADKIVPVHYQRRKNTERVLACGQSENALIPTSFHDVAGRFQDV